jgi:ketosteroid isomerase-like protein
MKAMMKKIGLSVLFSLLILASMAQSANSDMKYLVATMNKEMIDLAKAGRYEAMAKYYDESAISLPNYRAMEKGFKLILNNSLGRKQAGYAIIDGYKKTTEIIAGEDIMVDIGQYSLTVTFPGLTEPKVDNGKYMNVWKKDGEGKWRIVAETWNADRSPNAPATGKPSSVKVGQPVEKKTGTSQQP